MEEEAELLDFDTLMEIDYMACFPHYPAELTSIIELLLIFLCKFIPSLIKSMA
jgi:hypothetical protein